MSEDVRAKALRDAIFAVDQRLGNAEPEREWDHEERIYDHARFHAIEAIRALIASPTPPTTEGRERKQALAAINRLRAIAGRDGVGWGDRDDLQNAADVIDALLSSPRVEEVRREALEEAAKVADEVAADERAEKIADKEAEGKDYDPYSYGAGFLDGSWVTAQNIAKSIRSLSLPDGEGDKQARSPS